MGMWLTVGKIALQYGAPAITDYARRRLAAKAKKADTEERRLEDEVYFARSFRAKGKDNAAPPPR